MNLPLMALKNLRRHQKRTIITASAIAVGIMSYLVMESLLVGAEVDSIRNIVWYETSSARVYTPEGAENWKKLSLKHPLREGFALASALRDAGIAASARTSVMGELSVWQQETDQRSSEYVRALGIDLDHDSEVYLRRGMDLEGRWPRAGAYEAVLGQWLAEDLGLRLGQVVNLSTRTREGSYQVIDLEVVGLVLSPNPMVNRGNLYIPWDVMDQELGLGGEPGEIGLGFALDGDLERAVAQVSRVLEAEAPGAFVVLTWEDLASDFLALAGTKQKGTSLILFLIFIIAAVGISNTLLMAFFERRTEIGMLRAIGMDDRHLFWLFIMEASAIGLLGALMGLALGLLPVWLLTVEGIDLSFLLRESDMGYRLSGIMRGVFLPASFARALGLGVALAALTAILPTRRALRMGITDALRQE